MLPRRARFPEERERALKAETARLEEEQRLRRDAAHADLAVDAARGDVGARDARDGVQLGRRGKQRKAAAGEAARVGDVGRRAAALGLSPSGRLSLSA